MRRPFLLLLPICLFAGPDFFDAIRNGDQSIVAKFPNLANTPRPDGTTPLHHAVVTADAAMVDLLLRHTIVLRSTRHSKKSARCEI